MSCAFSFRHTPPAQPIRFDPEKCNGCNRCLEVCMIDVMLPGKPGEPPIVAFPDECWYFGCCVMECPAGAITLHHTLMNQTRWVEKASLFKNKEES